MGLTTGFLTKSFIATTAVPKRRFVKHGAADGTGVPAVDATKYIMGVSSEVDTAVGEQGSCFMGGNIADIDYGGTIARGDPLTADASGKAIKATTTGQFIGGYAEVSGVSGDIGSCYVSPGVFAAAA